MSQRKPNEPAVPPEKAVGKDPQVEDLSGLPGFPAKPRAKDVYEGSGKSDPRKAAQSEAAPEVSRGAWRERAFVPRGTMPFEQVLSELEKGVQLASLQKASIERARAVLKSTWAPLLRQAVEQGGGDGLDAHLRALLKVSGPVGLDPLVNELCASMKRLNAARQMTVLATEAKAMIEAVARAIDPESATRISLKVLERQLEGRIDVDALLEILFSDDDELAERRNGVDRTLDSLREQLRAMPGAQPDGMFSNYARLKVEKRVIEAEQARRGPRP